MKSSVASSRCFSWKHENKVPLARCPVCASLGSLSSTGSCCLVRVVSCSNRGKIRSDFSLTVILDEELFQEARFEGRVRSWSECGFGRTATALLYHRRFPYFNFVELFCLKFTWITRSLEVYKKYIQIIRC